MLPEIESETSWAWASAMCKSASRFHLQGHEEDLALLNEGRLRQALPFP